MSVKKPEVDIKFYFFENFRRLSLAAIDAIPRYLILVCLNMLLAGLASSDAAPGRKAGEQVIGLSGAQMGPVESFSALPVYEASRYGSIAAAVTDIGASDAMLIVSKRYRMPVSVSIPANVRIQFTRDGQFVLSKNVAVRMNLPSVDGPMRIFSGEGFIEFNRAAALTVVPQWWGARGAGVTDDTAPLQQAIDAVARSEGGTVVLARGTYSVDSLVLDSKVTLIGEGTESILKQKGGSRYCCSINPGSGGSPRIDDNKHDIAIQGIHFMGTVESDGFQEHAHLLNINAATRVSISDCLFTGWRGDAIYIGSSNTAGTERHNRNITIERCRFNGVNNDNRNAVTVIDGDGVNIRNNEFMNCTRQNMPGAVDIEPNANTFSIINDIRISSNSFSNIGGNGGVIGVVLPRGQHALKVPAGNIIIEGNTIGLLSESTKMAIGIFLYQMQSVDDTTPINNIVISKNIIRSTYRPFRFYGVKGLRIADNLFERSVASGLVAFKGAGYKCQDIEFTDNVFRELGSDEGTGITIFTVKDIRFIRNKFEDVGPVKGGPGFALRFHEGTAERVAIVGNTFRGSRTTSAVHRESHNKTILENNTIRDNVFDRVGEGNFPGITGGRRGA